MIADMHTHSESSHDSVCKIEDMYKAQMARGTEIFAVTDHFDTASFNDYDVFTPIKKAYDTVQILNEKNGGKGLILSGVEISEGFWYPDIYKKIIELVDYDVVVGSVHLVKYKSLTMAYSKIDFSVLSRECVKEYLDAYFDDVLTMLETEDFDILAHLTCPLRYINGKYRLGLDIAPYEKKIDKILKEIIKRNIALEMNTSSVSLLDDTMPDEGIITRYFEFGGRLVTLGSDAHVVENASTGFDKATQTLKKIGFENIYYYKSGKPYAISL